jgi:hypothetical protein
MSDESKVNRKSPPPREGLPILDYWTTEEETEKLKRATTDAERREIWIEISNKLNSQRVN